MYTCGAGVGLVWGWCGAGCVEDYVAMFHLWTDNACHNLSNPLGFGLPPCPNPLGLLQVQYIKGLCT